ncbi:MAG TPA: TlpA disulfide reductase family protein [Thermomicrobiaceae bacterium]|nr:TlpA disulfide reductase family protein [Thermomicrobiaceae bacterium]
MTAIEPADGDAAAPPRPGWNSGRLLTLVVAILFVAGVGFVIARATFGVGSGASGVVAVGHTAPTIVLPGLNGQTVKLSDLRGKVVLVNFWATWCPPCQAEMPELQSVYQARQGGVFVILGVDQAESADIVRPYVDQRHFSWTFALDQNTDVSRAYGVYGIPQSFLVDQQGRIAYIWKGPLSRSELEQQLTLLGVKTQTR